MFFLALFKFRYNSAATHFLAAARYFALTFKSNGNFHTAALSADISKPFFVFWVFYCLHKTLYSAAPSRTLVNRFYFA